MAMSLKDRQRIRLDRQRAQVLFPWLSKKSNAERINEGSRGGSIINLDEVEDLINKNTMSVQKLKEFAPDYRGNYSSGCLFELSLFFLSNKKVKVDPARNLLSYGFIKGMDDDPIDRIIGLRRGHSIKTEDFLGIPEPPEDVTLTVEDLTEMCDYEAMYKINIQSALDQIKRSCPTVFYMFNGPKVDKIMEYSSYGRTNTLYVTFNKRKGKLVYAYNPQFILSSVIEEYIRNTGKYRSLKDCYIYLLGFYICHEMMHIITNNTGANARQGIELNSDSAGTNHRIANIVMDSYINCWLAKSMKNWVGVTPQKDGLAPMPSIGVESTISLRAQHNVGFKYYANVRELINAILNLYGGFIQQKIDSNGIWFDDVDLNDTITATLAGADLYISLTVPPSASEIRSNSIKFQKFVNDLTRVLTDGTVFDRYEQLTDAERVSDKGILPNGTLVRIKRSSIICIVKSYDEKSKTYELNDTDSTVHKEPNGDGTLTCSSVYTDNGKFHGNLGRGAFVPFDPTAPENTWLEGTPSKQGQTKLSDDQINQAKSKPNNIVEVLLQSYSRKEIRDKLLDIIKPASAIYKKLDECVGKSDDECKQILSDAGYKVLEEMYKGLQDAKAQNQSQAHVAPPQPQAPKVLNVGDIVYVRSIGKFGRITAISNGTFELEEMKEDGVRVLDDSNLH